MEKNVVAIHRDSKKVWAEERYLFVRGRPKQENQSDEIKVAKSK